MWFYQSIINCETKFAWYTPDVFPEFRMQPRMVLLDCSKLQLGRGRRDDSVGAFRRRLEVFRELSLPMLKTLDTHKRLVIVDGDTESTAVVAEFTRVLLEEMEKSEVLAQIPAQPPTPTTGISSMQHFAHAMSRMGGGMFNGVANGAVHNGNIPNGNVANGNIGNGFIKNNEVRPINNKAKLPTVSQMTHDDVRKFYEQSSGDIALNTHM